MKFALRIFVSLILMASVSACQMISAQGVGSAQLALIPLEIKTVKRALQFKVEVARTDEEQARGLMFRSSLPNDGGMIFPMAPAREASFWMKDTIIPLDMIFIRSDGTIARIAAQTVPYDLTPVSSGEAVAAVLEIAGGHAAALGIAENDHVTWKNTLR